MLSIIGTILSMIGTAIMTSSLLMGDETIDRLSGTYVGENPHLKKKLKKDRRDAKSGLIFLGAGFFFQFLGLLLTL